MSDTTREHLDLFWELIDEILNALLFALIGLELILSDTPGDSGLGLVSELVDGGKRVFLDAKLLDIPNTVERSVDRVADLGATFLTVHGHDLQTLRAAVSGRGSRELKLLAVTVLTSLTSSDLNEQGVTMSPADLVLHRAKLAETAGFDGVIASGQEAAAVRASTGDGFLIVTPGIRLTGSAAGDQQRIMTPQHAITAGADHIVVGRPINAASDPRAAAATFVKHIAEAG